MYKIQFTARKIRQIVLAIALINVLFLAGTWLINSAILQKHSYFSHLVFQLDLGSENNIAAWYSSMLLCLCGITALICFVADAQYFTRVADKYVNLGWLVFASIFFALSFDELGSVHENIGDSLLFKDAGKIISEGNSAGWLAFSALVALVSLFMLLFGLLRIRYSIKATCFLITGLLFYLSNPFQENFEIGSFRAAADPATWKRPVEFLLLEEATEIFGSLFFLISLMQYIIKRTASSGIYIKGIFMQIKSLTIVRFAILFTLISALLFWVTKFAFGEVVAEAQVGVPKNWFTAELAFVISVYCFNALNNLSFSYKKLNASLFITGLVCIAFSIYFGSNIYAYPVAASSDGASRKLIINFILIAVASLPALMLYRPAGRKVKISAVLWFCIIIIAMVSKPLYSEEIAFIALSCLFYTVITHKCETSVAIAD